MVFSSFSFLLWFLPAVVFLYYLLPAKARNSVLFLASLGFYAFGEPYYIALFAAVILWSWGFGLLILRFRQKAQARVVLAAGLAGVLLVLCLFKYTAFTLNTLNTAFGTSFTVPAVVLPIGISFYTFQAVSYMVDVYRGEPAQRNLVSLGLYLSFFPQLIAGPIVRYSTIAPQIKERRTSGEDITAGVIRLTGGLCKKVLLANTFGQLADHVFDTVGNGQPGTVLLWIGALAYTLQIYFDFSGYSDMAVGLGRLFGFRLPENFHYPYTAVNATDFWHRWHMSLSLWFRDYVYIPLGGSRRGKRRQVVNLLIVWILTGFWHGAGWTFVLWGLLWGLALIVEKFVIRPQNRGKGVRIVYRAAVLVYMMLLWVIFRSPTLQTAATYIKGLFLPCKGINPYETSLWLHDTWIYFAAGIVAAAGLPQRIWQKYCCDESPARVLLSGLSFAGGSLLTALALSFLAGISYNPFLYFNF